MGRRLFTSWQLQVFTSSQHNDQAVRSCGINLLLIRLKMIWRINRSWILWFPYLGYFWQLGQFYIDVQVPHNYLWVVCGIGAFMLDWLPFGLQVARPIQRSRWTLHLGSMRNKFRSYIRTYHWCTLSIAHRVWAALSKSKTYVTTGKPAPVCHNRNHRVGFVQTFPSIKASSGWQLRTGKQKMFRELLSNVTHQIRSSF